MTRKGARVARRARATRWVSLGVARPGVAWRASSARIVEPPLLTAPPPLSTAPPVPNAGNGYALGAYSWTQTLADVVVTAPLPPGTKGRQVEAQIRSDRLRVGLKGQPPILGEDGG